MISWLRAHRHAALEAVAHVVDRPFSTLLMTLLLGVALALAASVSALATSVSSWAPPTLQDRLSVFLEPGYTPAASELEALRRQPGVLGVSHLDQAGTLQFAGVLLGDEQLGSALPVDLVPTLVRIDLASLAASTSDADGSPAWLRRVLPADRIVEVVSERHWRERLHALTAFLATCLAGLAAVLMLLVGLVLAGSVRGLVAQRGRHVALERLMGSTRGQARRPFLYMGFVLGFFGGCWGGLLVLMIAATLQPGWERLLGIYGLSPTAYALFLDAGWALAGPPVGAWLGWSAALLQTLRLGQSGDRLADVDLRNLTEG